MADRLKRYCEYIRNTGPRALPTEYFDDDWSPIGPHLRAELERAGLVKEDASQAVVYLTEKGKELADG